jgi:hypothetical protein
MVASKDKKLYILVQARAPQKVRVPRLNALKFLQWDMQEGRKR